MHFFFVVMHLHFIRKTFSSQETYEQKELKVLIWVLECRGVILCTVVQLCVFLVSCQEEELRARPRVVVQSTRSTWTTERNEKIIKG